MTTARQRAEEKREEKLAEVRKAVQDGSLVIRKMTVAERERYPAPPPAPPRGRRR